MLVKNVREGEKKRKEKRNPSFYLRFTEFRQSEFAEPRVKVYLLDEGYAWVQKQNEGFLKTQRSRFWEIKFFEIRRCS